MDTTIRVRRRGILTLPANSRRRYGIREGDMLRLADLDGVFVLTPLAVPALAHEIEKKRLEAGLSIEDLWAGLREQRERYYREHFADGGSAPSEEIE